MLDYVDAFAWYGSIHNKNYQKAFRAFQKDVEAKGFRGEYLNTEFYTHSPTSSGSREVADQSKTEEAAEFSSAKFLLRGYITNLVLGVVPFYCNAAATARQNLGLFRHGFASQPNNQATPNAMYYTLSNLVFLMERAQPTNIQVAFENGEASHENWTYFVPPNHVLVALYQGQDGYKLDVKTNVTLSHSAKEHGFKAREVIGIDILNGIEQKLDRKRVEFNY